MHIYAKSATILCLLLLCSACSNELFSKQWRIEEQYCQAGGDHLDVNDELKTSSFLFWKSLMANRADPSKNWKLKSIKYDAWTGNVISEAKIIHDECFLLRPVWINGDRKIQLFMKTMAGKKCDGKLIDATFMANVVAKKDCQGSHSGGWLAK